MKMCTQRHADLGANPDFVSPSCVSPDPARASWSQTHTLDHYTKAISPKAKAVGGVTGEDHFIADIV